MLQAVLEAGEAFWEGIAALPAMFHLPGFLQLTFSRNRVLSKMDWFNSVQLPF